MCGLNAGNEIHECAERSDGASGGGCGDQVFHRVPEGHTVFAGGIAERFESGFADSARRNVKHAKESDVVFGMHCETNIGEGILHFRTFVETEAPDEFVANAAAAESFFKGARLKVSAVLDCAGLPRVVVEQFLQFAGDEFSFTLRIARFKIAKVRSRRLLSAKSLAQAVWIVFDDGARGIEDALRRAVISFEAEDLRAGKIARKAQKDGNVRAAPAVDGLVFVADNADVLVRADE